MTHWATDIFEYGQRDGRIHHVTEVSNGLKCKCKCPACDEVLVAVNNIKGKKPRPYFRHYNSPDCNHKTYQETIVHYLAKQIIELKGYIIVPKITYNLVDTFKSYYAIIDPESQTKDDNKLQYIKTNTEPYKIEFEKIEIEKKERQIRPDLKIFLKGKVLIVEIAYSHLVDENKLTKIINDKIDGIEIILSHLPKYASKELIEQAIYTDSHKNIRWLNNIKNKQLLQKRKNQASKISEFILENFKALKTYEQMMKVYCPLKKNVKDGGSILIEKECKKCSFFLDIQKEINPLKEYYELDKKEREKNGQDTSELIEKYGKKVFYQKGNVFCVGHLEKELKIMLANG